MVATEATIVGRAWKIMFQDDACFCSAWAPPVIRPVVPAAVEREFRHIYGMVP